MVLRVYSKYFFVMSIQSILAIDRMILAGTDSLKLERPTHWYIVVVTNRI